MIKAGLIKPITVSIDGKDFIISKLPCTLGREIAATYPVSILPAKFGGEYKINHEAMLKLMAYVGVPIAGDNMMMLNSEAAINAQIESWETLIKVEAAMLEYNASFLQTGKISTFLSDIGANMKQWATQTLTHSLGQLWKAEKQRSTT